MGILSYGSLNIDHVYRVPHFVAPGETLSAASYEIKAGGKGANQSAAAALAGADVHHAGQVGPEGQFLLDGLAEAGVDTTHVKIGEVPTGHAIIQVDDAGQNMIIVYGGGNRVVTTAHIDAVLNDFDDTTTLLLQNEISNVGYVMEQAAARGMEICFNPTPMESGVLEYPLDLATTLVVNETEGAALGGGETYEETLANLVAAYPNTTIIVTLGGDGLLAQEGDESVGLAAEDVEVVDTTAAGDTFIGHYLARRQAGDGLREALTIANHAAAVAVGRPGALPSIPALAEVLAR